MQSTPENNVKAAVPNLKFDRKALRVWSRFRLRLEDILEMVKPDFSFKGVKTVHQLFQREDHPKYAGDILKFRKFLFKAFDSLLRLEGEHHGGGWFCEPHHDKYKGHIPPDYFFTHILPKYRTYAEHMFVFYPAVAPQNPDAAAGYRAQLDPKQQVMREEGMVWLKKFTDQYFGRVQNIEIEEEEIDPSFTSLAQIEEMTPKALNKFMALEDLDLDGEREEKIERLVEHLKSEERFYNPGEQPKTIAQDALKRLQDLNITERHDLAKPAGKIDYEGIKNLATSLKIEKVQGVAWGALIDAICEKLPSLDAKGDE